MKRTLDQTDLRILHHLRDDARITNAELSSRVELSAAGLQKRLRKLEEAGVIRGYRTEIDRRALGYDLLCFIEVTLHRHEPDAVERFRTMVRDLPEVLECHHITGEHDYLLKVAVRNTAHLERFLLDRLTPLPGMDRMHTSLVLSEVKPEGKIQIPEHDEEAPRQKREAGRDVER